MSPRVLHVIPAVAPRYGGPSRVVLATVRELTARGVRALIATTDADGAGHLAVDLGREATIEGAPVIAFRRDFSERFKWSRGLAAWLRAHVGEFDLVDIHAVFSHSSVAAARASARAGRPYIVRPHGALNPWGLSRRRVPKTALFRMGATTMLSAARAILYASRREQVLAQQAFPWLPRGAVVPPGVDHPAAAGGSASSPDAPPYVLVLSRLTDSKRIDSIVEAFHHYHALLPQSAWHLVIAGDGDAGVVSGLKRLSLAGPAASRIHFRGWVTGVEKESLLAGASLLAAPSNQESFGLALVEAMAHGVPVLTSADVDLAEEIAQAQAGWVAEAEPESLAKTLGSALGNREVLSMRGGAARRFSARFTWPAAMNRLQAAYDEVLERHSATHPAGREAP